MNRSDGSPVQWRSFLYEGKAYDLSHVHPRRCEYVQAASGGNPARVYTVEVTFSHHCFTRGVEKSEQPDAALVYADRRGDIRLFDFDRYALSQNLPAIVEQLNQAKCYHTGCGNYLTVRLMDAAGISVNYEVYFSVNRSTTQRGALNLYVHSAYVRDHKHPNRPHLNPSRRPNTRPVGFYVILHNTLYGKSIKPPNKKRLIAEPL